AYLTVYSREQNVDAAGQPLVYLNDTTTADFLEELAKLNASVGDEMANFIALYRQYGGNPVQQQSDDATAKTGAKKGNTGKTQTQGPKGDLSKVQIDSTKKVKQAVGSLFELVNMQVIVPSKNPKEQATVYESPLNDPSRL